MRAEGVLPATSGTGAVPAAARPGVALFWLFMLFTLGGCSGAERTSHRGEKSVAGAAGTARVPASIVIDGRFDDWASVPAVSPGSSAHPSSAAGGGAAIAEETGGGATATEDAGAAQVDLGQIRVARDVGAVYFRIDLGRPVNVQSLPGTLELILDADGDTLTGRREGGLAGADLAIHFTRPDPARPGSLRSGISVHWLTLPHAASGAWGDPDDIGLWLEPRTRTREIEVRVARGFALPGGGQAFEGKRLSGRILFRDAAGATRDRTPEFELGLEGGPPTGAPSEPTAAPGGVQVSLARPPETDFRVLSWNVSRRSLQRAPDAFRRIVAAADPDLVLFDEVSPRIPLEELEDLFAAVEKAAAELAGAASRRGRGSWRLYRGSGGGPQRGLIAVRRTAEDGTGPVAGAGGPAQPRPARELERLAYPDSVARIVAQDPRGPGLPEVAANLASRAGVPSAGAWVTLGGRRLLAVTLDLVCCGNHERSPQERIRRIESARIAAAVRRAVSTGGPDGVVVAGDFNLVGTVAPLRRMAEALDVDGSDLAITRPLQLDGRSSATWDEGKGPFPPGELDYVLYSDASLAVRRTFILDSRDFSERTLRRYSLRRDDSRRASDHMPLVTDLGWKAGAPRPKPGRDRSRAAPRGGPSDLSARRCAGPRGPASVCVVARPPAAAHPVSSRPSGPGSARASDRRMEC